MARKPVVSGGTRDNIIETAMKFFFERGFEATTVRAVMQELGSEAGLFYYYFKNKDNLFNVVIESFFDRYRQEADLIIENGRRDVFRLTMTFLNFVEEKVDEYYIQYEDSIHSTVRMFMREYALKTMESYIRQILEILVGAGAKLQLSIEATTVFIAHGVGSIIVDRIEQQLGYDITGEIKLGVNTIMGLRPDMADLMFPYYAKESDIAVIRKILMDNKDYIINSEMLTGELNIREKIRSNEIFVIRHCNVCVGVAGFSRDNNEINYLAISDEVAGNGVGLRLLVTVMAQYPLRTKLSVGFVDKGDYESANIKKFLSKFGFRELAELEDMEIGATRMVTYVENRVQNKSKD